MRLWLTLLTLWMAAYASAQLPFPDNSPVQIRFHETIKDVVKQDPNSDPDFPDYILGSFETVQIDGSAPINGFDISQIDESTSFDISIGNFDSAQIPGLSGMLSDDPNFTGAPDTSVSIPITGLDYNGDEQDIGSISLSWTKSSVSFSVSLGNVKLKDPLTSVDYGVAADDHREKDEVIDSADLIAGFSFGPFTENLRSVYTKGAAATSTDDRVSDILSNVALDGAIDYLAPNLTITTPAANASWALDQYTVTGTVQDQREIQFTDRTETYDSQIQSVEVKMGTLLSEGTFVAATVNGNNWQLPVTLEPGINFVTVRATDIDGNVTTTSKRKLTFLQTGPIKVEAVASNFTDGTGSPAGSVAGSFFSGSNKVITAAIGGGTVSNTSKSVNAGQTFTVTATPAPGAVFNGWTANLNGSVFFTSVDEKLDFETKPGLDLIAEFVPNPFGHVIGTYNGLITGDETKERGPFKIAIAKNGAFTGKAQFGTVTLPLKGKVLGSGRWTHAITRDGKTYVVSFVVELAPNGDRTLSGTITGTNFSADISADLKDWRKPKGTDAGRLANLYAGAYNVLLTPPSSNAAMPKGIGFGRVTISPLGVVSMVGALGDGTKFATSSILAARASGPVEFPLFIALDRKLGNVSGYVSLSNETETDLTAALTWEKPSGGKVESQSFKDTVDLAGSRYIIPTAGSLAMLNMEGGVGQIALSLPAYQSPATPAGFDYSVTATGTMSPVTPAVAVTDPSLDLKISMKISPATGLVTGTFFDPDLKRFIPIFGAVHQKADGGSGVASGVFVRGNRAGPFSFTAPPASN